MSIQTVEDVVVISVKPAPEMECAICNELVDSLISVCPGEKHDDHRVCKTCVNKMSKENEAIGCVYCGWRPGPVEDTTVEAVPAERPAPERTVYVKCMQPCIDSLNITLAYLLVGSLLAVFYLVMMSCLLFVYKCTWGNIIGDRSWCRHNGEMLTIENAVLGFVITLILAGVGIGTSLMVTWMKPRVKQLVDRCYGSQNEER
jgi:hypothetical protein